MTMLEKILLYNVNEAGRPSSTNEPRTICTMLWKGTKTVFVYYVVVIKEFAHL